MNWISTNISEPYLKVCKDAACDDEVFDTFKTRSEFIKILEHADKRMGWNYISAIRPELMKRTDLWSNDNYGGAVKYRYGRLDASPNTLQYIYVLSELMNFFGDMTGFTICEIGGGYGGQCKMIKNVFDVDYTIIDLPEVLLLQKKYLSKFGYEAKLFTPKSFPKIKYDLVISNYALSEITEPLQSEYINNICMRSSHGYLTCNYPLKTKIRFAEMMPDVEGERKQNYRLVW